MNFSHLESLGVILLEDFGFDVLDIPLTVSNEVLLLPWEGRECVVMEVGFAISTIMLRVHDK